jgi:hypothetical protein
VSKSWARSSETIEKIRAGNKGKTLSSETKEKIRVAGIGNTNAAGNKGGTQSLEARRNMSLARGGDGHLDGRHYPGLGLWTRLVKERDNWKCAECGYQGTKGKKDVDAHHVLPKVKFPELATVLFNGVTLCKPCHKEIHAA